MRNFTLKQSESKTASDSLQVISNGAKVVISEIISAAENRGYYHTTEQVVYNRIFTFSWLVYLNPWYLIFTLRTCLISKSDMSGIYSVHMYTVLYYNHPSPVKCWHIIIPFHHCFRPITTPVMYHYIG